MSEHTELGQSACRDRALLEAADAVLEALERVEVVAQEGDMEDLDRAYLDLSAALDAPPPVRELVTDEIVTRAAEAMEDAAMRLTGRAFGTIHRDRIARAALEAALLSDSEDSRTQSADS